MRKKAELSKKQEDERKKTALEKKIPLDETEIKTLADQINVAEQELVRLQTEYANEEKNLNELKEQVKDSNKRRGTDTDKRVYPEKRKFRREQRKDKRSVS